jgi:NADPH:quinone reductase-like Zn-dependent oxidoreductase
MKKIVIQKSGGYDRLEILECPDLKPAPEQVLVDVVASGVNYADCCVRWGVYESAKKYVGWPITPGFEFSGTVRAIGSSCRKFKPGDRVYGVTRFNAYASQVVVPEHLLFHAPDFLDLKQLAGVPTVFFTAYHALFQIVHLFKGSEILVHSAAGGVGSALCQLALAQDFQVTGVVGASSKVPYLRELGVQKVIDKSKEDLWRRVQEFHPKGLDAIFDANGYTTFMESYRHLRASGKLICYGSHSLLPHPDSRSSGRIHYIKAAWGLLRTPRFNPLHLITENKTVCGFNLSFLFDRTELISDAADDLLPLLAKGIIKPLKTAYFSAESVAAAHRALESGQTSGKLVLTWV